jgi:hypothetical protein
LEAAGEVDCAGDSFGVTDFSGALAAAICALSASSFSCCGRCCTSSCCGASTETAVAGGEISLDEGRDVSMLLESHRRTIETAELEERISKLEKAQGR